MYITVLPLSMCTVCQPCEIGARRGHWILEVTYGCKLPCGWWELNPGPLQEWWVLLTDEPSLWAPGFCFGSLIVLMLCEYVIPVIYYFLFKTCGFVNMSMISVYWMLFS